MLLDIKWQRVLIALLLYPALAYVKAEIRRKEWVARRRTQIFPAAYILNLNYPLWNIIIKTRA